MKKQEITNKFIQLFTKLLNESNLKKQEEIAGEISKFSGEINNQIEREYSESRLQEIQESCLPMEHWKDGTGYCDLTEKDIKKFIGDLKCHTKKN